MITHFKPDVPSLLFQIKKSNAMKQSNTTLKFLTLFFCSLIFMNFQCEHCENRIYDHANYSLSVSSIGPTFSIGDTIVLGTNFSSQIPLEKSGLIHDNAGQYISCVLEIFAGIPNTSDAVQARDSFTYVDMEGQVSSTRVWTWEIYLTNTCGMSECTFSFGLVPQKSGYYGILLSGGMFDRRDDCQEYQFSPTEIKHIENSNNFNVFEEIHLNSITINNRFFRYPGEEKRFYFFKVIE